MNETYLEELMMMSDYEINEIVKIKALLELNNNLQIIRQIAILM